MPSAINWDKIVGRAAVLQAATPENPITVKESIVNVLKMLSPERYQEVQQKIHSGAYILEA